MTITGRLGGAEPPAIDRELLLTEYKLLNCPELK